MLGGTGFLGYHTTRLALEAGHEVWLFNRGRSRIDAFPDAKRLIGDRKAGDLDALASVSDLDAVIDCTGYFPGEVTAAAEILEPRTRRYLFVSTVSVYASPLPLGGDEDSPLAAMPADADPSEITGATYGPLKVACEEATRAAFGERATIVRPTLIVGPEDPTDRFTYWVRRGIEGGPILAPGDPARPVQFIDARDLAAWMLELCADERPGTFNAVSAPTPFGELLAATAEGAEIVWRSDAALIEAGLAPWSDLPLWIPAPDGDTDMTLSNKRALSAGLEVRPLRETVADTRAWDLARGTPPLRAGISRERQDELAG
jgi:2'-hydroxyisoflavone reductase